MAIPGAKYAIDSTTTLNNGTELKWTKQIKTIYPNVNDSLDLSCTYSEMATQVFNKTGYAFKLNSLTDQYAPSYGSNIANTRRAKGFTRNGGWTKNIWVGTVLTDQVANSSNVRRYFFGYTNTTASIINGASGGNARILRDIKVNKLLFKVTIKGYRISDYNSIDYTANPFSSQSPSEITIKLSELAANPNNYIVTTIFYENTLVYGPNGNQKWLGGSVYPQSICYSADVGGFHSIPFIEATPHFAYSYQTSNGHPNWTGGVGGSVPVNLTNSDYMFGCDTSELKCTLPDTYANIDNNLQTLALAKYGEQSSWTNVVYFNKKLHNLGAFKCIELIYGTVGHAWNASSQTGTTQTNTIQSEMTIGISGDIANKWIAGLGLYFIDGDDEFNPNDANITPETMYASEHIWLGEMTKSGVTTGTWIKGHDIENYTGPNKSGNINDPKYAPQSGGGSGGGDNETDMPLHDFSTSAGMVNYYLVDRHTAQRISDAISEINWQTIRRDLLPNMISYKIFAAGTPNAGAERQISVGGVDLEEQGQPVNGQPVTGFFSVPLGSFTINETFGDFRDYAPYTKIEVYVPCCGWAQLPPWCMGKTISGEMFIDMPNGSCKAVLKSSRTVVAELGGSCAVDIPFTATANGVKTANIISNIAAGMTSAYNPTPQNIMSSAMGVLSAFNSNYTNVKGVNGDGSNLDGLWNVYVKVTRPASVDNDGNDMRPVTTEYLHEHGRPCGKQLTLASGDGYTQVIDAHINGAMTDREKQMIKDAFRHGLIL